MFLAKFYSLLEMMSHHLLASSLVLEIGNSRFNDDYLISGNVRVIMDYVLQSGLIVDLGIRASLGFNTSPATAN